MSRLVAPGVVVLVMVFWAPRPGRLPRSLTTTISIVLVWV
ncbi:hypothetical protein HMPREF9595_02408 [Cutibacterium acnes HL005PA2]|nr:hypothetical protein HMPREF9595_02408 [Cutibacterium acnes HL005PA2]EFT51888.1 hypothetical protein HMPREF9569_02641 [Cutibacterium acnes HL078PA1]EFT75990.1 hypothetical protein HMPREF9599_00199 [Cutibacterium acnes HL050PA2]